MNRRQFCGLLGTTVAGSAMLDFLYVAPESVCGEETSAPLDDCSSMFSVAKIPLETWFTELRHKPLQIRLEELRRRLSAIRECSDAVVFLPAVGLSVVFQDEVFQRARETGLRVFMPPNGPDVTSAVLETIRQETLDFSTVAFPLCETKGRPELVAGSSSRMASGYLYTRCFHESQAVIPQAIVLFETSRCLWELYVSADCFSTKPSLAESVWNDGLRREYARLLDQTNVQFSETDEQKIQSVGNGQTMKGVKV